MAEKADEQAVCARCGAAIDIADCFVIRDVASDRAAHLCRTEHIVAWVMRGAEWQLERPWEFEASERRASGAVTLIRARAGETIEREFTGPEELREWAAAGGFWSGG